MQGVAENFIHILRHEERRGVRSLVGLGALIVLVLLLAGLVADLPERGDVFGTAAGLSVLGAVAGAGLGVLWTRLVVVRGYRRSLVASWNQWMRYSVACERVDEVHRRVLGRPATRNVAVLAAVWAFVLFMSFVVFVVTVLNGAPAWDQAPLFMAYSGLLAFLFARRVTVNVWAHTLLVSLDDLVRRKEVSLWGVL